MNPEEDKLNVIIEKLDKIIELLTPQPLTISPPISDMSKEDKEKIRNTLLQLSKQNRLYC